MIQQGDTPSIGSGGISRRAVVAGGIASLAALGVNHWAKSRALAIDITDPPADADGITAYSDQNQVFVRWNNSVALGYRSQPTLKYPYFAPLNGPITGVSLTTESSLPYPHHRGLWLGCEPLNGGDYWSDGPLDRGHIRSSGVTVDTEQSKVAIIRDACQWVRQGAPSPIGDRRRFAFSVPSDRVRLLDVELDLTAADDLRIDNAKHSFFALRAATDISPMSGGTLLNSNDEVGAASTFGRPAKWCGYFGRRALTGVTEGIAILNHPDNFGGDCPWFTRDYGHLSPSPFNFLETPWTLERGATLSLRYCVVLFAGTPRQANLDSIYKQWVGGDGWFVALRSNVNGDAVQSKSMP